MYSLPMEGVEHYAELLEETGNRCPGLRRMYLYHGRNHGSCHCPRQRFSLTMPGQIQHYDLTVGIEDFAMEEKLSPAERRHLERERWERERRRREMERRRRHHRPPPPPPRRRHYPPPRRHWSADVGQTANMFQLPNGTIAALTE